MVAWSREQALTPIADLELMSVIINLGGVMDSAEAILLAFAVQWSEPIFPIKRVEHVDLQDAELAFGIRFPEDYRAAILSVGLPYSSALLSAIVDQNVDLRVLSELFPPKTIIEQTLSWREIGLPANLIAIADDVSGNKFCFDVADIQGEAVVSAPVYFWDHDFDYVTFVASSFSEWIGSYIGE